MKKLTQKKKLILISCLAGFLMLVALLAPLVSSHDPYTTNMGNVYASPTAQHILGTDNLGRDEWSRLLWGLRPSLFSSLLVVTIVFVAGTFLGTIAGYFGGICDKIVLWLITSFQAFPGFLLAVVIAGFLGSGLKNACLALILVYWTSFSRLARGLTMSAKKQDYLQAAILGGCSHTQILLRHIAPNILSPLLVTATSEIGSVIVSMAGLSFLGLSSQRPTAEWGVMLSEAQELIRTQPLLVLYISCALILIVLVFNLLGDYLRDYLDKRYTCL